jgi:hypothetical protein
MQPHKRKVLIMMAVSSGIIAFAFLLPIVIIPAYLGVSDASNCAVSSGCAGDTFDKCGAYQSSGDSTSFTDSLDRGMKGMLCMMGLDGNTAKAIAWTPNIEELPRLIRPQLI